MFFTQPRGIASRNGNRTIMQVEGLSTPTVSGKGIGGQTYTYMPQFEIFPVFAETSAALDVKEQIAVFHPDVTSDIDAPNGMDWEALAEGAVQVML